MHATLTWIASSEEESCSTNNGKDCLARFCYAIRQPSISGGISGRAHEIEHAAKP